MLHLSMWCSYPNEDLCWLQVVDDTQGDSKDDKPVEWIASWKPNITINLVDDFTRYVLNECQLSIRFCMWYEIIEFRPHYLIHSAALIVMYISRTCYHFLAYIVIHLYGLPTSLISSFPITFIYCQIMVLEL